MRTFICAKNEAVVINGEVIVTVIDILDKKVVLAVDAQNGLKSSRRMHLMGRRPCPLAHVKGLGRGRRTIRRSASERGAAISSAVIPCPTNVAAGCRIGPRFRPRFVCTHQRASFVVEGQRLRQAFGRVG